MAHIARDEKFEPPLTGQYLCVPALLPPDVVPEIYQSKYLSRHLNKDDPVLKGLSLGEGKSIVDGERLRTRFALPSDSLL